MSRCRKPGCKFDAWRKRLYLTHWKESQGFTFDQGLGCFVRRKAAQSMRGRNSRAA